MRARPAILIDEKDQSILRVLQADARISNKDLAARIGLSNSACLERVRKLERAGIIRGYHAHVAPDIDSKPCEIWANIILLDLPPPTQDAFEALVASCAHIVAAFQLSGAFDCVVHFVADDAFAWRLFCGELAAIGVGPDRVSFGLIVGARKRRLS